MFNIGLGEIVLIIFIAFLVSPKDLPKVMRYVGNFIKTINDLKNSFLNVTDEIRTTTNYFEEELDHFVESAKKSSNAFESSDDELND